MCSSDSAGVQWMAHNEANTVEIYFRCLSTNVSLYVKLTEPSITHIIGTKLKSGTVCQFEATTRTADSNRILDTVTAGCMVGGMRAGADLCWIGCLEAQIPFLETDEKFVRVSLINPSNIYNWPNCFPHRPVDLVDQDHY